MTLPSPPRSPKRSTSPASSSEDSSQSSSSSSSQSSEASGQKKKKRRSRTRSSSSDEARPGSSLQTPPVSRSRTMDSRDSSIQPPVPSLGHRATSSPPSPPESPDLATGVIKPALGIPYTVTVSPTLSSQQSTPETSPELTQLSSESDTDIGEARRERLRLCSGAAVETRDSRTSAPHRPREDTRQTSVEEATRTSVTSSVGTTPSTTHSR